MLTSSKYNAQISERASYKDSVPLKINPYNTIPQGKDLLWQLKANRDRTIYIPPENRGLTSITTQDALNVSSHVESTTMDDGSSVCGDPVSFPFLKSMESRHHPLQHTQAHFESPAKVFAKLKSKVQRSVVCVTEGLQTEKDMLSRIKENQGAAFNSPRKGKENIWTIENIKENQRCNFYHDEAEALTLSLTPSPKKSLNYIFPDLSCKPLQEMSPMKDIGNSFKPRNGYTLTKRPVLEPTAVSYPLMVNSDQTLRPLPLFRDLDVFKMTNKTPIKGQPPNLSTEDGTGSHFHNKPPLMSPAKMFAHMKERERKRKWEQQEFYKVSSSTRKLSNGGPTCQPQDRLTSTAFGEDNTHNNSSVDVFGSVPGSSFPANHSEMNLCRPDATDNQSETDPSDGVSPPAVKRRQILVEDPVLHDSLETSALKQCYVLLAKNPLMSSAKMFAHMKERKRQQQDVCKGSSSTREHRNGGHSCPSRDSPASTTFDRGELEDDTSMNAGGNPSGNAFPINRSRLEVADSQSDIDPSDDVLLPPVKSQPALVEDPLVIESPRIALPKKLKSVFERNTRPMHTQFSNATEIYLMKWSLKFNCNGLYVDGIHREDNIPWHSNIIVERVSKSVLKTVSGRTYILVGKMNKEVDSELPKWLLKKFVYGFPPNWKMYYEKFLSESRDGNPSMQAQRSSKGRGTIAWPASEKPATNLYIKQHGPKPLKTPASCPPTTSSLPSDTKVSRSGRMIKPPLEYWKGGRVILDANMNVTIHEGYDTTICKPQVTTPVSRGASQRPARVFLPCNEGPSSNNESSVPLRKVKTSHRKRNRAKANPEKSSNQIELPEEALTSHINSPEEWSGRTTRSSQRCQVTKTTSYTDSVPQTQVQSNQSSKRWSKKLNCHCDTGTSPVSVLLRKPNIPAPAEPQASTSGDELSITRMKRGRGVHRRRGRKVLNKSQPSHLSPPSQPASSSEDSGRSLRKRTTVSRTSDAAQKSKVHQQNKCNKTSPPPKPAPKLIQSSKKSNKGNKSVSSNKVIPQEKDEDEWTEAELLRLQEAVTSCPKHMGSYWVNVAMMVGTRSAEECQKRHTSQGTFQAPAKRPKKSKKGEMIKEPVVEPPTITARVGTLKRKQQVRQFLEAMPKEDLDDVFSSSSMQSKRFQLPSMSPGGKEDGFKFSDHEPLTPVSAGFPAAKTPQCLHITPGMMGSPNRNNDDKYIYQLQKRMKKNQVKVYKHGPSSKNFTPTPSVKRTMRRCGNTENDTFVMWEMFPDSDAAESGEEEDFYFSDKD